ncbi:MAG: putative molybdenum carrier protein [Verrucomicrobiota bacterium]
MARVGRHRAYLQRTEWNVRDTDGTVVFTLASEATGGSLKTLGFARKHRKPCIHIPRDGGSLFEPALQLQEFVKQHGIKRLNLAGSRESKEPGIYLWVMQVLDDAFFWAEDHPGVLGGPGEG